MMHHQRYHQHRGSLQLQCADAEQKKLMVLFYRINGEKQTKPKAKDPGCRAHINVWKEMLLLHTRLACLILWQKEALQEE